MNSVKVKEAIDKVFKELNDLSEAELKRLIKEVEKDEKYYSFVRLFEDHNE